MSDPFAGLDPDVRDSPAFVAWRSAVEAAGNEVLSVSLEWKFAAGPHPAFLWVVHAEVLIAAEGRVKSNEVVVGRPDISVVVAHTATPSPLDARVLLVREFRTPSVSRDSYVRELPGGSSWDPAVTPAETALDELAEETGLRVPAGALRPVGSRQMAATLASHQAHAFAVVLSDGEMDAAAASLDPHGVSSDSERTWVEVRTVADMFADADVDWSMLGIVAAAVFAGDGPTGS